MIVYFVLFIWSFFFYKAYKTIYIVLKYFFWTKIENKNNTLKETIGKSWRYKNQSWNKKARKITCLISYDDFCFNNSDYSNRNIFKTFWVWFTISFCFGKSTELTGWVCGKQLTQYVWCDCNIIWLRDDPVKLYLHDLASHLNPSLCYSQ